MYWSLDDESLFFFTHANKAGRVYSTQFVHLAVHSCPVYIYFLWRHFWSSYFTQRPKGVSWFWSEVILTISRSLEEKVKNSCSVYIFLIEKLLFHTNIEYDLWSVECHNFYPIPFNQVIGHWKKMQNLCSVYYKCFLWIPRNFTHRSFITWKCVWFWPKVIWASSRSLERKR